MTSKPIQQIPGRKARTHAAIMSAASQLFTQRGVSGTTIEQIAQAAGVSVGSVYVHFGSKEHLQQALITQAMDINARYIDEARQVDSPLARIIRVGDAYRRFAVDHTSAFRCVVMRPLEPVSEAATRADEMISARVSVILAALADDLREAIAVGEIEPVPIADAIAFIWGAWSGVTSMMLRQDSLAISPEHAARALDLAAEVLIRGLKPDPGGEHAEQG